MDKIRAKAETINRSNKQPFSGVESKSGSRFFSALARPGRVPNVPHTVVGPRLPSRGPFLGGGGGKLLPPALTPNPIPPLSLYPESQYPPLPTVNNRSSLVFSPLIHSLSTGNVGMEVSPLVFWVRMGMEVRLMGMEVRLMGMEVRLMGMEVSPLDGKPVEQKSLESLEIIRGEQ